jgi:hypothetical protein
MHSTFIWGSWTVKKFQKTKKNQQFRFPREEVGGSSDGALYHTTGAVCTVVEIDVTTGEHWV